MEWYLKVLRQYSDFNGRARRKEYWMFALVNLGVTLALGLVLGGIATLLNAPWIIFLIYIYSLAIMIPQLAVGVRRLHDQGKSGWMLLVGLIPLIGGIWLIIMMATEGDRGSNEYGPDPKSEGYDELNEIGIERH